MFIDEIKQKLGEDITSEYAVLTFGNSAVAVEGIKQISSFSPTEVIIRTKKGKITVKGERLSLRELGKTEVYVVGVVYALEFS